MEKTTLFSDQKDMEDYPLLKNLNSIFRKKRGFFFKIPKKSNSVILLLSGGLDSVCLWNLLLGKYKLHVYPLYFFKPGNECVGEKKAVKEFSNIIQKKYPGLYHKPFRWPYHNIFSYKKNPVNQALKPIHDISLLVSNIYKEKSGKYIYSYIGRPARMPHFVLWAYEYACRLKLNKQIPINTIFIGFEPLARRISRETTLTVIRSLNLSLCTLEGNFKWQIIAPIDKKSDFYFTRKDLIKYAEKNSLPLEKTFSCLEQDKVHCGRCTSCRYRIDSFKNSKFPDTTKYGRQPVAILKKVAQSIVFNLLYFPRQLVKKVLNNNTKQKEGNFIDKVDINGKVTISENINWEIVGNTIYLLNKKTGTLEGLNDTGSFLWKTISENNTSIKKISVKFTSKYKIREKRGQKDAMQFIKKYSNAGYLNYKKPNTS